MGQASSEPLFGSVADEAEAEQERAVVSTTPPEVDRRRRHYLHRLGIGKDARAGFAVARPEGTAEAPDRLESTREEPTLPGEEREPEAFELNVLNHQCRDDFRVAYLSKLSYRHVWTPTAPRPPRHQTVSIFDWDDTLLPTSYVGFREDEVFPESLRRHLRGIEQAGSQLLELAQRAGHTFIITNAMPSWVEYSAAKFLPGLLKVLEHIPVISARGEFENQFPGEHGQWKVQAFLQVQKQLDSQIVTNLISLGDSIFEMDAVHVMGREFAQAVVKTVKFREAPTAEELHKELELVASKFDQIVAKAQNLKITLERMPKQKVAKGEAADNGPPEVPGRSSSRRSLRRPSGGADAPPPT